MVETAKETILQAIRANQQCFWPDIIKQNADVLSVEVLLEASRESQASNQIRLREDSYEHAMEYMET